MKFRGKEGNVVIILVAVGAVVLALAGIGGYAYLNSQKSAPVQTAPAPTVPQTIPQQIPTSTVTPPTAQIPNKQFNTLEEAMAFALAGSGMQYADTAKVDGIKLLYTPTYKNWTFNFRSRTNPHKSEKTFATEYDVVWTTVKIKNTGEVSVDASFISKNNPENGPWSTQAKPSEAAISTYFDLAKQKVSGAGLTPGTIISAEFSSLGSSNPNSPYNNKWKIAVVLAGEESKAEKKAKTVVITQGNFEEMYDSTVTIY